ncbi:MAG: hypothetical protein NZ866_02535 [Patescibacteria group bacterium]|nr:hypothetical protein [Patescibacteria group bacterium]
MFKKISNKSFTVEEIAIALFIFLIYLGTIFNSYFVLINSHFLTQNKLQALQNLKMTLDKLYVEMKRGELFTTSSNSVSFINIQNCQTTTILFSTTSDNIGYLTLVKNNSTSTLTDPNLVNIENFNVHLVGIITTTLPARDIRNNIFYFITSFKSITLSIKAYNILKPDLKSPINIQMTVQPFNSFLSSRSCFSD